MKTVIEIKNLSLKIKNKIILNRINLKIKEGEKIALLGKSGAGKTTLISILNGSKKQTSGRINIYGKNFSDLNKYIKKDIGTIWQDLRLLDDLSVEQNVNCGLLGKENFVFSLCNLLNISSFKKAHKCMQLCKLNSNIFSKNINEISGGQKQRVAISRLIIQEPKILFGDEPFNNLDPKLSNYIKSLFISGINNYNLKLPNTIFLSIHRIDLLDGFTRIIGLKNGEIIFNLRRDNLRHFHLEELY